MADRSGDSIGESAKLLEKRDDDILKTEESAERRKRRRNSMLVLYLTMFFNSIVTTVVYSSLWPYLRKMDPKASTWYLGIVHAGFNTAELCCIIAFGIWVHYRRAIEPLVTSLVFFIIGSLIYIWAAAFGYTGKYLILVSRIVVGCSTGNDVIVTTLVSEQTTVKERTKAMTYLALASSLGFSLGPAVQACFVPIGEKGVFIKGLYLRLNMYTASGVLCVLCGIINIIAVMVFRKEFQITPTTSKDEHQENETPKDEVAGNNNKKKPDILAIIAVLVLFFITRHTLVFIEVMFAPLAMDQYALSNADTLVVVGVLLAFAGVVCAIVFLLTEKIAARIGDRIPLTVSIFGTLAAFAVHWPMSNRYPTVGHYYNTTMYTPEGPKITQHVTLGCAPSHSWCKTTPLITLEQFGVGFTLAMLCYPVSYCLLPSLFTQVIQPGRQGILVSLFSVSGNLSRIIGPALFTAIYSYGGPKGIFGLMDVALVVACIIMVISYKRLVPFNDNAQTEMQQVNTEKEDYITLTEERKTEPR